MFQFIEEFRFLLCKPCGYGIAARTQNMHPCREVGMVSLALRKAPSASALDEEHFGEQPAKQPTYCTVYVLLRALIRNRLLPGPLIKKRW